MALVIVPSEKWDGIESAREWPEEVHFRLNVPFSIDDVETKAAGEDIIVRGPVYVGNDEMLDRHGELVDMEAIVNAWSGYSKNPVILYNHSKTYGVIGVMTDVEMGTWGNFDFEVPIGRAIIDGGEKDIVRKIRKGMLRSFSIGFMAKAAVKECIDGDEDNCYMKFTDIEWVETSVVDIPSSREALFHVEKRIELKATMSRDEHGMDNDCNSGCSCNQCTFEAWASESPVEHPADPVPAAEVTRNSSDLDALSEEVSKLASVVDSLSNSIEPTTNRESHFKDPIERGTESEATRMTDAETQDLIETTEEVVSEEVHMPSPTEALMAVTTSLNDMNERIAAIEAVISKAAEYESTIEELSEKVKTLTEANESLTEEKAASDEEARINAEVAKRVAELAETIPDEVAPERKTVIHTDEEPTAPTRQPLDPAMRVTPGLKGLSDWLEAQLVARGGIQ